VARVALHCDQPSAERLFARALAASPQQQDDGLPGEGGGGGGPRGEGGEGTIVEEGPGDDGGGDGGGSDGEWLAPVWGEMFRRQLFAPALPAGRAGLSSGAAASRILEELRRRRRLLLSGLCGGPIGGASSPSPRQRAGGLPDRCFSFLPLGAGGGGGGGGEGANGRGENENPEADRGGLREEDGEGGDGEDDDPPPVPFECDFFLLLSPVSPEYLLLDPRTGRFEHGADFLEGRGGARRRPTGGRSPPAPPPPQPPVPGSPASVAAWDEAFPAGAAPAWKSPQPSPPPPPPRAPPPPPVVAPAVLHPGRRVLGWPPRPSPAGAVAGGDADEDLSSRTEVSDVTYVGIEAKHLAWDADDDDDEEEEAQDHQPPPTRRSGGGGPCPGDPPAGRSAPSPPPRPPARSTVVAVGRQLALSGRGRGRRPGGEPDGGDGDDDDDDGPVVTEVFSW
jgi:hypothetical protein